VPFVIGGTYGLIAGRRTGVAPMNGRSILVAPIGAIGAVFMFLVLADVVWGAHHLTTYDQVVVQSVTRALLVLPGLAVPAALLGMAACGISQRLDGRLRLTRRDP
jgi:hypothetical protein